MGAVAGVDGSGTALGWAAAGSAQTCSGVTILVTALAMRPLRLPNLPSTSEFTTITSVARACGSRTAMVS